MSVIPEDTSVTVPIARLDESNLRMFTLEQNVHLENQRRMLDDDAAQAAQVPHHAILQHEAKLEQLANAHVAQQCEIAARHAEQTVVQIAAEARSRDAARQTELIASEAATMNQLHLIAQSNGEMQAEFNATRDQLFLIAQQEDNARKAEHERSIRENAESTKRIQQELLAKGNEYQDTLKREMNQLAQAENAKTLHLEYAAQARHEEIRAHDRA